MIPYGRQNISQADVDAVVDVLSSDFLTQGPQVPAFEKSVTDFCGAAYGVAVNSATSALHIACLALGAGPGDVVWTSPITFVASANCALYCGADVSFVDIDPATYNMSVARLEEKLRTAAKAGALPKIVIPVHLSGQSCDMVAIRALADEYGFKIIEDASHAIGGSYRDEPIGNCRYSDITVFSFHPVKIITTAEGGMAMTNSRELARRMELLRAHGVTRDAAEMTHESDGAWYYQQIDLGFNYRLTDLQAALGLNQMKRLSQFVSRRREIAARYDEMLVGLPLALPWQHPDTRSAFHLYIIRLKPNTRIADHKTVYERLRAAGIGVNLHYIPVPLQPYFKHLGHDASAYPEALAYYAQAISIPVYYGLSPDAQDQIVDAIKAALPR
jgi:UDP-4-amino-4,6-dideoxy-N-acetyl-beta-L-altrosamine transaminase